MSKSDRRALLSTVPNMYRRRAALLVVSFIVSVSSGCRPNPIQIEIRDRQNGNPISNAEVKRIEGLPLVGHVPVTKERVTTDDQGHAWLKDRRGLIVVHAERYRDGYSSDGEKDTVKRILIQLEPLQR